MSLKLDTPKTRMAKAQADYAEITRILNEPGMTWKVRRALLREKFGFADVLLDELVPPPPEGKEFHPSDY